MLRGLKKKEMSKGGEGEGGGGGGGWVPGAREFLGQGFVLMVLHTHPMFL